MAALRKAIAAKRGASGAAPTEEPPSLSTSASTSGAVPTALPCAPPPAALTPAPSFVVSAPAPACAPLVSPSPLSTAPAPAPTPTQVPVPVPVPAPAEHGAVAGAKGGGKQRKPTDFQQGFLSRSGGALYPEGSTEAAPPLWRGSTTPTKPVFELVTFHDRYEVVGRFNEAKGYLGKEDFEVNRTGSELHIRGNPQNDPQSLVAGLDEKVKLPLDSKWEGMSAEFKEYCLRISVERMPEVTKLLEELRKMLPEEEASKLIDQSGSAEELAYRLAQLAQAAAQIRKQQQADEPPQAAPPSTAVPPKEPSPHANPQRPWVQEELEELD